MKSEYLITFDAKDPICTSADKFKNFLAAHTSISFGSNDTIGFHGADFPFRLEARKISNGARLYTLTIENIEPGERDAYTCLLDEVIRTCSRISNRQVITLHDGVGEDYCVRAYPIVYKTAALMRKFVTMFLLSGLEADESEVATDRAPMHGGRRDASHDGDVILREASFTQDSDLLFARPISGKSVGFIETLKEATDDEVIRGDRTHASPVTRWDTHFASKVNCSSEYLRAKCDRVHQCSAQIARHKGMAKHEFEDLALVSADICEKLQAAMRTIGESDLRPVK